VDGGRRVREGLEEGRVAKQRGDVLLSTGERVRSEESPDSSSLARPQRRKGGEGEEAHDLSWSSCGSQLSPGSGMLAGCGSCGGGMVAVGAAVSGPGGGGGGGGGAPTAP
jgi:hypothetical protein